MSKHKKCNIAGPNLRAGYASGIIKYLNANGHHLSRANYIKKQNCEHGLSSHVCIRRSLIVNSNATYIAQSCWSVGADITEAI